MIIFQTIQTTSSGPRKGFNDLLNRKKKNSKVIAAMKRPLNQGISHDPLENANILNRHFASIGNRLASVLPSSVVFS